MKDNNVICLRSKKRFAPVEETANYTVHEDGSITVNRRGMRVYATLARRLGVEICTITTVAEMKSLQKQAWDYMLAGVANDSRLHESTRSAVRAVMKMSSSRTA